MNIQGRDCTLTLFQNDTFTALPYTRESIHSIPEGFSLDPVVGEKKKEIFYETRKAVSGCFTIFLYDVVINPVFKLIKRCELPFTLISNHIYKRTTYDRLFIDSFELQGRKDEEYKLKVTVKDAGDACITETQITVPEPKLDAERFWVFRDGTILADGVTDADTIYYWVLRCDLNELKKYSISLHCQITEINPLLKKNVIKLLQMRLDTEWTITLNDLHASNDFEEINCADVILGRRDYRVEGLITIEHKSRTDLWSISL